MKKQSFLLAFILISITVCVNGQWTSLGKRGSHPYMVNDTIGYTDECSCEGSPSNWLIIYDVYRTTSRWNSAEIVYHLSEASQMPYCYNILYMKFFTPLSGMFIRYGGGSAYSSVPFMTSNGTYFEVIPLQGASTFSGSQSWWFFAPDTAFFFSIGYYPDNHLYLSYIHGGIEDKQLQLDTCCTNSNKGFFFSSDSSGFFFCTRDNWGTRLFKTDDRGLQWITWFLTGKVLKQIYFPSDSVGYAICDTKEVIKSTDGGNTWVSLGQVGTNILNGVAFTDETNGYVIGNGGTIMHTIDGGATWDQESCPVNSHLVSIQFVENKTIGYIAGSDGILLRNDFTVSGFSEKEKVIVKVHPNPFWDIVRITSEGKGIKGSTIIYSMAGEKIFEAPVYNEELDLSFLPSGFYIARIKTSSGSFYAKMVKE